MQELGRQIELLAASGNTTVLITGESGTGKGFVARMIHDISPRAEAPFVDINAGGLNATFLDSELFGHEKGAFTDAKERKRGLFELAHHGTVFLDELLKVLESKTFRRVGGTHSISADVRLITATNKTLNEEVGAGRFREDLYYRLNVLPIHMPPVRERSREDKLALLEFLLADVSSAMPGANPTVEPSALQEMLRYRWPGNVREMRNVIERAMILAAGEGVRVEHLPVDIRKNVAVAENGQEPSTLADVERRHVDRMLRWCKGNRTHAARQLGISRATLIKKIKVYQLDG
jgi:DNA-binding NtrC family response regulator